MQDETRLPWRFSLQCAEQPAHLGQEKIALAPCPFCRNWRWLMVKFWQFA